MQGGLSFFLIVSSLAVLVLLLSALTSARDIPNHICSKGHVVASNTSIQVALHHVNGPCSPISRPKKHFSEVARHDDNRIQYLMSRLSGTTHHNPLSSQMSVPLKPGLSAGTGNFIVSIGLGTPTKQNIMVVDTGSTLTWMQCQPCTGYCHPQVGSIFDPTSSSTYQAVPCGTPVCTNLQEATLNPSGCSKLSNRCLYQASYGDQSYSIGFLSKDTLTIDSGTLSSFIYGCGVLNQGLFGRTAGIIGLSQDKYSLFSQFGSKYGKAFSYCLPTPSSTGSLSFGAMSTSTSKYAYTPMYGGPTENSLYFLKITRISVGNHLIQVPSSNTKTLIDSGTVITRLPDVVYKPFKNAFAKATSNHPSAPAYSILDTCLKASSKDVLVPDVEVYFEGGSKVKLESWNLLIDIGGVTCLAFASDTTSNGVSIFGNRQQQTMSVVYDVANSRIGFAAGGCT